ncbi:MAG TPA: RHS repeat-associated core domain-containing protein [Armatimonadota bacterium]|nr:RHS repeat-associated core domain-containing protein [Armatimonadota bacterium]
MTGTPQSRYYFFDATGSTRNLVDDGGSVVGGASYTAWGSVYYGVTNTPMAWQGRWGVYTDSETGLSLCGARCYAPSLGRFISRFPAGFMFGAHRCVYCGVGRRCSANPPNLAPSIATAPVSPAISAVVGYRVARRNGGWGKIIIWGTGIHTDVSSTNVAGTGNLRGSR